jgi:Holliday junction resolvase RusA-like endonuclease
VSALAFFAFGEPAPQGSKRVVPIRGTNRYTMVESSPKLVPWRNAVALGVPAREHPLDGPIAVRMVFTMATPKYAGTPRVRPRRHPVGAPDLDKLARSTCDAITDAGGWADDARVVEYVRLAKVWSGYDAEALPLPGVVVAAIEVGAGIHHVHALDELYERTRAAAWAGRGELASWR